ncbi:MAG: DUF1926 domain-containing protein [Chloroflexi bacterium]|nr:DUF1926 domain-containing protein [Chloroflexota bacterium]
MKQIHLALAIHNHQPVGNFDFVFAEAYTKAYLPMLALLERHPAIKLALHYTGPLRDWIAAQQPDFLKRVRALAARGQIELMTGGYYEPILAAIPDADKRGQILKLTRAVKKDFGYDARGLWLAERVWEPHLAKPIADAGVEYTLVDDTHFKYVGLSDDDLFGYYVTEEQGTPLKIFGTSKHLRYAIPWTPVEEVIGWLRAQATEDGARVAVMGDDGEKFGLWPQTYEHCWGSPTSNFQSPTSNLQFPISNAWMENFFQALEQNAEWLHTITLAEYQKKFPALGRIYLPTTSYDEMTEWALPAQLAGDLARLKHQLQDEKREDILRFIKGAFWRNFLIKYPEVNAMHKKMLYVSEKVNSLEGIRGLEKAQKGKKAREGGEGAPAASSLPSTPSDALSHLWASQCNCPYWHGVFGGIYLPHIRHADYAHLIEAEMLADQIARGTRAWVNWELRDYDKDSRAELLVSGSAMNLYFDLARGGAITEWDWRAKKINLVNTLARRAEGYHRDLDDAATRGAVQLPGEANRLDSIHSTVVRAKEAGLEKLLTYDWHRRVGLIDHFLAPETTLEQFARAEYRELGDFVDQEYKAKVKSEKQKAKSGKPALVVALSRDGHVWQGDVFAPLRVEKQIVLRAGETHLPITYILTNSHTQTLALRFGAEFCFALLAGHSDDAYYRAGGLAREQAYLDSRGEIAAKQIAMVNEWLGVEIILKMKRATRLWRAPIETISLSEAGFERVYQGSCVLPMWDVRLAPGAARQIEMEIELKSLPDKE